MFRIFESISEFIRILTRRLRGQGFVTTMQWLRTVGLAWLTGRVSLRFSEVTPNILIGPQYGRFGKSKLQKAGVTASVSMRAEYDDEAYGLAMKEYSYLPTVDNTAPSIEHLQQGVEFMRGVVESGGTVYVHCGSGVGRAPTMVAAYLISQGMSVQEAIDQIHAARPFIRVLPSQKERLVEYEAIASGRAVRV